MKKKNLFNLREIKKRFKKAKEQISKTKFILRKLIKYIFSKWQIMRIKGLLQSILSLKHYVTFFFFFFRGECKARNVKITYI